MIWFVVYETSSGRAQSIGTVLADPMPDEFTAVQLSDTDAELLLSGGGLWDASSLSVQPRPPEPEVTDDDLG